MSYARRLGALALAFAILLAASGVAQAGASADLRSANRLDSVARLIAGLPPTHADHAELARTAAWREHARAIQASWSQVRDGQRSALTAWRSTELPRECPAGETLLYPFSGPDFLNAHWLFPDCAAFVLFGLEQTGGVPDLEGMGSHDFTQLLSGVRNFMINLFVRNYFVTGTMHKDLRTEQLRGVVPVFMVLMALSGAEVLRISPIELRRGPGAVSGPGEGAAAARNTKRPVRGVSIEFRAAGSGRTQRLDYFSLDVANAGLAGYPEFIDYLRSLAPTTTLIKAASYLLHDNRFSRVREAILDASGFVVQDETGMPYSILLERGWQLTLYGRYDVPIPPFEYAYQPALATAYGKEKTRPLPFRFGYQLAGDRDRSNLMVARRPAGRSRAGTRTGVR
jgi:hypothetical protein